MPAPHLFATGTDLERPLAAMARARRLLLGLLVATPLGAQGPGCPPPADTARPVVRLSATVQAQSLQHHRAPEARVAVAGGCPGPWIRVDRGALPRPVVPGATYRDVTVRLEVRAPLRIVCSLPGDTLGRRAPPSVCLAPP